VNLLPFARLAALRSGARMVLFTFGAEAWTPKKRISNRLVSSADAVVSIRQLTLERLFAWSGARHVPSYVLENAFDVGLYGVGPRRPELVAKYGLADKRVIMTLARLDEPLHGVDEVLDVLPALVRDMPDLVYLVAGSGKRSEFLRTKTRELGLAQHVVFTGEVPEEQKADYYRLGDAFVMPGSHETLFDTYPLRFSFLEALACGLPVVGTRPEDLEVQRIHLPIIFVDSRDRKSIISGIRAALSLSERRTVPNELGELAFEAFQCRLWEILGNIHRPLALAS